MLDFRIETFLAVCRYLNFTRAAEALCMTQPAVTRHIHFLQDYYGVKLFTYEGKRLTLTPEGEQLRWAALAMCHDEEKLKRELQGRRGMDRPIRFGATMSIGEYAMPAHLSGYLSRHPDADIYMAVDNTQHLLDALDRGDLDFAVVEGYFTRSEFDSIPWSSEPFFCVCAANYALPNGTLSIEDLLGENLILRTPGSGSREVLVHALAEQNCYVSDFRHTIQISDLHVIKELVKNGCGITFLYGRAVARELEEGSLRQVPVQGFPIYHEFTFLWRKGSIFESEFRSLFEELCGFPQANA
ncbi:LysR family transcriptional regulator [Intestinibacillus massiliensis]|uniref:LysR family transcriptional regulator n=1 Tax=Intestinibacillus massiliensis TaxID=1871029 RepID=UPI000B356C20|nr:LysR family transcriptional regulator [Intestinibacillus massiliensis]